MQTYRVLGPGKVTDIRADDYRVNEQGVLTLYIKGAGGTYRDVTSMVQGAWLQIMDEEQISGTQTES